MQQEHYELDLKKLFQAIIKRWWIILITTVLCVGIAAFMNAFVLVPIYSTHTTLFVGTEGTGEVFGISWESLNINSKLVGDYHEIARSRTVAKEVIKELGLNYSVSQFQSKVEVTSIPETRIFMISYEDPDPELVTAIVNKLSEVLIQKAQEIVNVNNIQVLDKAEVPYYPIKPNKMMSIMTSFILGVMVGVFIIFLIELLDNTIKTPEDVEKILGLNVLGTIPIFEGGELNKNRRSEKKRKIRKSKKELYYEEVRE